MARRFPFVVFLPPVVLTMFIGGLRQGLLAAILSGLAADYLLIEPVGSFALTWPVGYVALGFFALTDGVDVAIIHGMTLAFTRADRAEHDLSRLNGELERRALSGRRRSKARWPSGS